MDPQIRSRLTNEHISRAIDAWGGDDERILLDDVQNVIYRITISGEKKILRLSPSTSRSFDEVRAELDWMGYLIEHGIPAERPNPSRSGHLVKRINVKDGYFTVCVFDFAEGDFARFHDGALWDIALLERWGALLGRMHALSKDYEPRLQGVRRRNALDEDPVGKAKKTVPAQYEQLVDKMEKTYERIIRQPRSRNTFGLIHNDLNPTNMLIHGDFLTLIDFDDCSYNYFVHDIAMTISISIYSPLMSGDSWRDNITIMFGNLMKGYLKENRITKDDLLYIGHHLRMWNLGGVVFSFEIDEENRKRYDDYFRRVLDTYKKGHPLFEFDFGRLL